MAAATTMSCNAHVRGERCGARATHAIVTDGRCPWLDGDPRCERHAEMLDDLCAPLTEEQAAGSTT